MPIKAHMVVPALKDQFRSIILDLSAFPTGSSRVFFVNPWYDYEIRSITALVSVITTAAASPFTLGYGAYTDRHGVIIAANTNYYMATGASLDGNAQSFSTQVLPLGTRVTFALPADPILPVGAPLIVVGSNTGNTGEVILTVVLRPKDLDRGDPGMRPGGAADFPFASYYK